MLIVIYWKFGLVLTGTGGGEPTLDPTKSARFFGGGGGGFFLGELKFVPESLAWPTVVSMSCCFQARPYEPTFSADADILENRDCNSLRCVVFAACEGLVVEGLDDNGGEVGSTGGPPIPKPGTETPAAPNRFKDP